MLSILRPFRFVILALLVCVVIQPIRGQSADQSEGTEVRAVWLDRSSLVSRSEIRATVEQLAAANFNLVLVNVWSRGYPLWPSRTFEIETGFLIDPGFVGRDPLAEVIEESARVGLYVMPWFEYGFIGGYSGYFPGTGGKGPIFDRHPEWLALTRAGTSGFSAPGGLFYWMVQVRPDVQDFLLQLVEEVAASYQVVGIQFDRVRYPQLDCGYDEYTTYLYQQYSGIRPPDNPADSRWMKWRSEGLNSFTASLQQRVKKVSNRLLVSNAPIVYPYSFVNFAQEYPVWVAKGSVDFIVPQIYRRDSQLFEAELERQIAATPDLKGFIPGIDSTNPSIEELIRMVLAVRRRGLSGMAIWYYRSLHDKGALTALGTSVFSQPAQLPWGVGRSRPLITSPPRQPRPDGRMVAPDPTGQRVRLGAEVGSATTILPATRSRR